MALQVSISIHCMAAAGEKETARPMHSRHPVRSNTRYILGSGSREAKYFSALWYLFIDNHQHSIQTWSALPLETSSLAIPEFFLEPALASSSSNYSPSSPLLAQQLLSSQHSHLEILPRDSPPWPPYPKLRRRPLASGPVRYNATWPTAIAARLLAANPCPTSATLLRMTSALPESSSQPLRWTTKGDATLLSGPKRLGL